MFGGARSVKGCRFFCSAVGALTSRGSWCSCSLSEELRGSDLLRRFVGSAPLVLGVVLGLNELRDPFERVSSAELFGRSGRSLL